MIHLRRNEIDAVIAAAEASSSRYGVNAGHYANTLLSHIVGRAGELAAEMWFTGLGFTVAAHWRYKERERLCDIEVEKHRVEVKTWSARFWNDLGRCVAVGQVDAVSKKAGVVLWATVTPSISTVDEWRSITEVIVELKGYSTMNDIREAPIRMTGPIGRQVQNRQVDTIHRTGKLIDGISRTVPCGFCKQLGCLGPHVEEIHWLGT